jgi:hypothetical protein
LDLGALGMGIDNENEGFERDCSIIFIFSGLFFDSNEEGKKRTLFAFGLFA